MNTVPNCSSPCLNGTGEPEETNLPVPPLSLRLDSPAYSVYSDGEYCNTYVDSASSVDGSSRPGSDRQVPRFEFEYDYKAKVYIVIVSFSPSLLIMEDTVH